MQLELNFNKLKCEFFKDGTGKTKCPYIPNKLVGTVGCVLNCSYYEKHSFNENYIICNYQRK